MAGLGDAGFFICFNVPKGFVSEVPHCSRDLELTGTASSFISLGQDAELGGVESQLLGGRKAATPVCVGGGRVVRRWKGQGGSRRSPPIVFQALCQEPAVALGTKGTLSFLR